MRIVEEKEVVKRSVEKVTIGRICDCCREEIKPDRQLLYNYFRVVTSHHDWGNDSIDSIESYDACCAECAWTMAKVYLEEAEKDRNTMEIEIEHVCRLNDGTDREYPKFIEGTK